MSGPARVLAFVAACAVLFGLALGIGRAVGPVASEPAEAAGHADEAMAGADAHDSDAHDSAEAAGHGAVGLEASSGGYALQLTTDGVAASQGELQLRVLGPDGEPVTAYEVEHEKELHLIVVRRDLTGFQHVHPVLDDTGVWRVPVDLAPGAWRVIADFRPAGGEPLVLGTDLLVPGEFRPEPLGADSLSAHTDGYDVTLGREVVDAGEETVLTATVTRGGQPVTDLQPYLGAYGHLVSLRDGDVGYLHVHPDEDSGPGPAIAFDTEFPTAGRYRLFLDFRHGDQVHTVAFTVTVDGGGHDH